MEMQGVARPTGRSLDAPVSWAVALRVCIRGGARTCSAARRQHATRALVPSLLVRRSPAWPMAWEGRRTRP